MASHVDDHAEVLIIGSGFAGSYMAAELAESGFDVVTLEAGPERTLSDMISSQIWSRRLKWNGPPVVEEGDLVGANQFCHGPGNRRGRHALVCELVSVPRG